MKRDTAADMQFVLYKRVRIAFGVEKIRPCISFTLLLVMFLHDILKVHQNPSMRTPLKCEFQWISSMVANYGFSDHARKSSEHLSYFKFPSQ